MLPSEISLYFFICLEFLYLLLVLSSVFIDSRLILWAGYILAGFKFSISSLLSIDIITYNIFYEQLGHLDADVSSGIEIGFVYLLYVAKSLNFPLIFLHFLLVIFFLFSVNSFFSYLLPKHEANALTLVFGLFPVGGELCIYLLRQLVSTSVVILGLSFSLKGKKLLGLITFLFSLTFHISSIIYLPFFLIVFLKKNSAKIIVLIALYVAIIVFFFLPPDLFMSFSANFDGGSEYTSKYDKYTTSFEDRADTTIGSFSIIIVGYLLWCLSTNYKQVKDSKIFYYACSAILIFITYIATEINSAFWMSSRIKFISTMLVMSSDIIMTTKFVVKSQVKLYFSFIIFLLFCFSIFFVSKGNDINSLFRLPFL